MRRNVIAMEFLRGRERQFFLLVSHAGETRIVAHIPIALHWHAVSFAVFCNPVPPELIERVEERLNHNIGLATLRLVNEI